MEDMRKTMEAAIREEIMKEVAATENAKIAKIKAAYEESMQCAICLDVMVNPLRACANDHYFCAGCINEFFNSKGVNYYYEQIYPRFSYRHTDWDHFNCPVCRNESSKGDIISTMNRHFYEHIPNGKELHKCTNSGCLSTNLYGEERAKHVLTCIYQTITCKYCDNFSCSYDKLDDHIRKDCNSLPCRYCTDQDTKVLYTTVTLKTHCETVHTRHSDIQRSVEYLMMNLDSQLINRNSALNDFTSNNVPVNHSLLRGNFLLLLLLFWFSLITLIWHNWFFV
jgi:hypothetical protein